MPNNRFGVLLSDAQDVSDVITISQEIKSPVAVNTTNISKSRTPPVASNLNVQSKKDGATPNQSK
jgi:hypothetical protein